MLQLLLKLARAKGMCAENYARLARCESKGELVKLYKRTIDWALENDYPPIGVLRDHFRDVAEMGVFVDHTFKGETLSSRQVYVFHNCSGVINVEMDEEREIIPMLYFANDCHIHVESEQPIRIPLYIAKDGGVITFNGHGEATFKRYEI